MPLLHLLHDGPSSSQLTQLPVQCNILLEVSHHCCDLIRSGTLCSLHLLWPCQHQSHASHEPLSCKLHLEVVKQLCMLILQMLILWLSISPLPPVHHETTPLQKLCVMATIQNSETMLHETALGTVHKPLCCLITTPQSLVCLCMVVIQRLPHTSHHVHDSLVVLILQQPNRNCNLQ